MIIAWGLVEIVEVWSNACGTLVMTADQSHSCSNAAPVAVDNQLVYTEIVITNIIFCAAMAKAKTKSGTKARVTPSVEEAVALDIWRTADLLFRRPSQVIKSEKLSPNQYNVLRILRGAPEGLACGDIAYRMLTRDPDITRLLDRLERRGLISRHREGKDRRMVLTRITAEGLKLLARLDRPMQEVHHAQLGHMGRERLRMLTELLRESRRQVS